MSTHNSRLPRHTGSILASILALTVLLTGLGSSAAYADWFPSTPSISITTPSRWAAGTRANIFVHSALTWAATIRSTNLTTSDTTCQITYAGRTERDLGVSDSQYWVTCPASSTGKITFNATQSVTLADKSTPILKAQATITPTPTNGNVTLTVGASNHPLSSHLCPAPTPFLVTATDSASKSTLFGLPVTLTLTPASGAATVMTGVTDANGQAAFSLTPASGTLSVAATGVGQYTGSGSNTTAATWASDLKVDISGCQYVFRATSDVSSVVGYGDRIGLLTQLVAISTDGTEFPLEGQPVTLAQYKVGTDPTILGAVPVVTNTANTRADGWVNLNIVATSSGKLALLAGGTSAGWPGVINVLGSVSSVPLAVSPGDPSVQSVADVKGKKAYNVVIPLTGTDSTGTKPATSVAVTLYISSMYPKPTKYSVGTYMSDKNGNVNATIVPPVSGTLTMSFTRAKGLPVMVAPVADVTQVSDLALSASGSKGAVSVTAKLTPARNVSMVIQAAPAGGAGQAVFQEIGRVTAGRATKLTVPRSGTWLVQAVFAGDELGGSAYSQVVQVKVT